MSEISMDGRACTEILVRNIPPDHFRPGVYFTSPQ